MIQEVITKEDLQKCGNVIVEFRSHLKDKDMWAIYELLRKEAYRIIFIEEDGIGVAFAGYRFCNNLGAVKTLRIDDLYTLPNARKKGYAGQLLDHIVNEAMQTNCNTVTLASTHNLYQAHKLYMNKGFIITAHYFRMAL